MYSEQPAEISKEVTEFLKSKGVTDVQFVIAVDGKGNIVPFSGPDVEARELSQAEIDSGIPSTKIRHISSSSIVGYEGSTCWIYQTIVAGQLKTWKFCTG